MSKRTKFTVQNFNQVVHDPKGSHLFGQLLQDHHQLDLPVIPAHSRLYVQGRRGDRAMVVFPHDTVQDQCRVWSDGDVRVVPWHNIQVLGRFNRKQFQGVKK